MRILLGKHSGFCFGVRRAVALAGELAGGAGPVYTYGNIIHNEQVVEQLAERGVRAVDGLSQLVRGDTLILRAHGVPPEVETACAARGIRVVAVPGPTAMATALALSGLPTGRFTFEGFLSMNKKSRREHLLSLRDERRTMVFYEAPHKLPATLRDLLDVLGDRRVALARELTKVHEEVIRTTLAEAAARYADGGARGEFVLVIEGAPEAAAQGEAVTVEEAAALALALAAEENLSPSEAAKRLAAETGLRKSEIYHAMNQKG